MKNDKMRIGRVTFIAIPELDEDLVIPIPSEAYLFIQHAMENTYAPLITKPKEKSGN